MSGLCHTRDECCPRCGGGCCDLGAYGARWLRFVLVPDHREVYREAFYAPDHRTSRNELERLSREYATLPPRHSCWCRCPREDPAHGYPPCSECLRLRRDQKPQEAVEIGRGSHVNAPMPSTLLLDLSMAMQALGVDSSAVQLAQYLNGPSLDELVTIPTNGHVIEPEVPHTNGYTNGHAVLNGHVDQVEQLPAACSCLGYRLGGAAYCQHLEVNFPRPAEGVSVVAGASQAANAAPPLASSLRPFGDSRPPLPVLTANGAWEQRCGRRY